MKQDFTRLKTSHYKVECGIPIPDRDLFVNRVSVFRKRAARLFAMKPGETIKVSSRHVQREKSRYTASMSKHKKRLKWKFSTRIYGLHLMITRIK